MLAEVYFAKDGAGLILGSVLDISKSGILFTTLRKCDQKKDNNYNFGSHSLKFPRYLPRV